MEYQTNPIISGFSYIAIHGEKNNPNLLYENGIVDCSRRLLRFWGNDYPYLNKDKSCVQGCLPIPENSDAQKVIRRMAAQLPGKRIF